MNIPKDASLDVKASFKDVYLTLQRLEAQWVNIGGSRISGAADAVSYDGLTTLRQLRSEIAAERAASRKELQAEIDQLKKDNNLI